MEQFVTIKTQFEIYIVMVSDIPLNIQIFWFLTPGSLFNKTSHIQSNYFIKVISKLFYIVWKTSEKVELIWL